MIRSPTHLVSHRFLDKGLIMIVVRKPGLKMSRLTISALTRRGFCGTTKLSSQISLCELQHQKRSNINLEPCMRVTVFMLKLFSFSSSCEPRRTVYISTQQPKQFRNKFKLNFNGELMNENWKINVFIIHSGRDDTDMFQCFVKEFYTSNDRQQRCIIFIVSIYLLLESSLAYYDNWKVQKRGRWKRKFNLFL